MPPLIVELRIETPMFGTWRWAPADFDVPLVFSFSDCLAELRLVTMSSATGNRQITWQASLRFIYEAPHAALVEAVRSTGDPARRLAESLHEKYLLVFRQLEVLLRTRARIRDLPPAAPWSLEGLFGNEDLLAQGPTWRLGSGPASPFRPRLRVGRAGRRIRPLFKKGQLVTSGKWRGLQRFIDEGVEDSPELMELLRAQARLEQSSPKVPTIEAAVFMETLLRSYGESVLRSHGFSKKTIRNLQDDLTFNALLNLVLPLTLTRSQLRTSSQDIAAVNSLRKVRNDLVHGSVAESQVDVRVVSRGIDGAVALLRAIKKRRTQLQLA